MPSNPFSSEYVGTPATLPQISPDAVAVPPTTTTEPEQPIAAATAAHPKYGLEFAPESYGGGKPRRVIIRGKIA